jgi:hypothetical protein
MLAAVAQTPYLMRLAVEGAQGLLVFLVLVLALLVVMVGLE